jgi:cellulose synthase/poly-beta-1,6-N-acetylglucosamine synthase-like glycosyltransferase
MVKKVSLYIPCYNVEQYIALVLGGVLRQTCAPDEIIIVDDGCKDRTVEVAARYPVRVIRHETNKGLAAACNTGVRNSRNELVASVSADVVPDPDWLEKLVALLDDPNVALAGGKLREGVLVSASDFWRQAHMSQDWGNQRLLNPSFVFGNNLMIRKKAVEEVGGYDEKCRRAGEDVDISSKIRARGHTTLYEPAAQVTHIRRDTVRSVMATRWRWQWYRIDMMSLRSVLGRAIFVHGANVFEFFKKDVRRKNYNLLWLDFLTLYYMPYFDFCLHIKTITSPER